MLDPFAGDGVCVGFAVYGAAVAIAPLLQDGSVADELTHEPGVTGEILVSAPHVKDRYDTLWVTEEQSISTPGWHHTGDVGHLDASGRLWVEGRLAHVLLTSQGVLTPVAAEQSAESLPEVRRAALVAVGLPVLPPRCWSLRLRRILPFWRHASRHRVSGVPCSIACLAPTASPLQRVWLLRAVAAGASEGCRGYRCGACRGAGGARASDRYSP